MVKTRTPTAQHDPSGPADGDAAAAAKRSAKPIKRRTLDERIADATAILRALESEKRKRDQQERQANEREVRKLLESEGLLGVNAQTWRGAMAAVKAALGISACS